MCWLEEGWVFRLWGCNCPSMRKTLYLKCKQLIKMEIVKITPITNSVRFILVNKNNLVNHFLFINNHNFVFLRKK